MTDANAFAPDWLSPPGDTIEDLLDERGWTKAQLAERTGFTAKHVNELVKGRAPISADAAERLSRVLGSTPDFWLVRDAQYQAAVERRRALDQARSESDWLDELPLSWMRKRQWVASHKDKGAQVRDCLQYFGVASVSAWRATYVSPLTAFRTSTKLEMQPGAVATWLREAERRATARPCAPFDKAGFKSVLASLRALTNETDPTVFAPKLMAACAAHGVAVVFVPAPPGCPASGATRWLTPDKAMLVLSLRHKSNDHLWFTFFHEAAHLLLHGKKLLFIEGLDGLDTTHEHQADAFARDWLIPPPEAKRLAALSTNTRLSKLQVQAFAETIGLPPGIVVGRMQNEGWLPWSHMNDLKVRYDWQHLETQSPAQPTHEPT